MTTCTFNGRTNPRTQPGQHHEPDELNDDGRPLCRGEQCRGCLPCDQDHCAVCGVEHTDDAHPNTCAECVAAIRKDLDALPRLVHQLSSHAAHGNTGRLAAAPIPGGDATVMLGPSTLSHGRAWYDEFGKDSSHKDDQYDTDEQTPGLILATIEDDWRDLNGEPTELLANVDDAITYLTTNLSRMAQKTNVDISENAGDIAHLRYLLEELLHDGERNDTGAPCVHCGTDLVRVSAKPKKCKHQRLADDVADLAKEHRFSMHDLLRAYPDLAIDHEQCGDRGGLREGWECLRCHRRYSDHEYRYAVGVSYLSHATALTATELERKTGVAASIIRVWGSRGLVAKRGRDEKGRLRYDVRQVEARLAPTEGQAHTA